MKDMLKSKGIIMFTVVFLGITYINAIGVSNMKDDYKANTNNYIEINTI